MSDDRDPDNQKGQQPAERDGRTAAASGRVPDELRYWRVADDLIPPDVEIEGEAILIGESDDGAADGINRRNPILVRLDEVIGVHLDEEVVEVNPGATARFTLAVFNHGERSATFEVRVEGWLDESWVKIEPTHLHLRPGEQISCKINLTPPRLPTSKAGPHHLAFSVRSPAYPDRWSRVTATLLIRPFEQVGLGELQPRRLETSLGRSSVTAVIPVTNHGNRAVLCHVYGEDVSGQLRFAFSGMENHVGGSKRLNVSLGAGQTAYVTIRVDPRYPCFLGLRSRLLPFRVCVGMAERAQVPASSAGHFLCRPLVGPWHLALLGLVAMASLLVGGTLLLGTLLVARFAAGQSAAGTPAVAPAPIALVLGMANPVPDGAVLQVGTKSGAPVVVAVGADLGPVAVPDPALPVVRPEQVSPPGSVVVAADPPSLGGGVSHPMTYAQLFQEIALRYDLDWRMLAAQAYVESRFDTLALGDDGDLGLMQVLPGTWKEWAPATGAADPFDSYDNVLVAAAYLDYLRTELGRRGYVEPRWMLVAYNWGPDQLFRFLDEGHAWSDLAAERQRYASDILGIAASIPLE